MHTPTPWHIDENEPHLIYNDPRSYGSQGGIAQWEVASAAVAPTQDERYANAAFIVRACNAHDELVTALKIALNDLAESHDESHQGWEYCGCAIGVACRNANAALEKAEA